ncbi:MAG: DUF1127 domain-containing protein [Gammaproteobacteria bacterium]|nr:DUF1127 domain-containing protein [Gammaproteobacteria bacterium]
MTTYTEKCSQSIVGHQAAALDILTQLFRQWMKHQQLKFQVAQERRQLTEMSDSMLRDLGISRAQAQAEAMRSGLPAARLHSLERGNC